MLPELQHLCSSDGVQLTSLSEDVHRHALTAELCSTCLHPPCPRCGTPSFRQHSHYTRHLTDLPWADEAVQVRLHVRRCYCPNPDCPQRLFAERFPDFTQPYARRTSRLTQAFLHLGLALGGRPGQRLAEKLHWPAKRQTLLNLMHDLPAHNFPTPRVLGVDDWALRKGHTYGTILVNLETHQPVDLLPDRSAASLAAWLEQHPGVEIVARDRASVYAEGVRQGAPDAEQVADRWHLLKNLGNSVQRALIPQQKAIRALFRPVASAVPEAAGTEGPPVLLTSAPPVPVSPSLLAEQQHRDQQRQALFNVVQRLRQDGHSFRVIAREVGCSRNTVRKYASLPACPERQPRRRGSQLEDFKGYLVGRWNAGCHNARELWVDVVERGFQGGYTSVKTFVSALRQVCGERRCQDDGGESWREVTPVQRVRIPSIAALSCLITQSPESRTGEQRGQLECVRHGNEVLERMVHLAEQFALMVRERDASRLGTWLESALDCGVPALKGFALGVWRDLDAVRAGLTLEWSSGPVEGQVNRLKTLKRQMYGRAGFQLLRHRFLSG